MNGNFTFIRRIGEKMDTFASVRSLFKIKKTDRTAKWLFFTPYDYDAVLGAGMLMQAANEENIRIKVIIATDGSQGYTSETDKDNIVDIRRKESVLGYFSLGIKNIEYLNFPDLSLHYFVGRSEAIDDEDYCVVNGFGGLQNVLTYHIRKFQPNQVFVCNRNEAQPEYNILFRETVFSLFNAHKNIWPELGEPLKYVPDLIEFPVFRNLSKNPGIKLQTLDIVKRKKLDAMRYFKSQKHIEPFLDLVEDYPPEEYFYESTEQVYDPLKYRRLFEEQ